MNKSFRSKGFIFGPLAIAILIAGAVLYASATYFSFRCHAVKTFAIGNVDPRFKIARSNVQKIAIDAANRWNEQTGQELLRYDPNSKIKINLIYDQRQADIDNFNSESQNLQQNRQTIETSKEKFNQLMAAYQADLASYNTAVSYWNSHGGASEAVFGRLQQTQTSLNQRRDQLIAMSKTVNVQADSYNSNLQNLQVEVDSRKNLIITQGLYTPASETIDIYTFGNDDELRLVLMHELGHALGLDHDQNTNSIMYYLLGNQDLSNPTLTTEDKQMLDAVCSLKNPKFYRNIFQTFNKSVN